MTWRSTKWYLLLAGLIVLGSCRRDHQNDFTRHPNGYWWKLIAFSNDSSSYQGGSVYWVNAAFSTLWDSVFYDSEHDLRDRFFVRVDSSETNQLRKLISGFTAGDSAVVLVDPILFFKQQFNIPVPQFIGADSAVKISFRIKQALTEEGYRTLSASIVNDERKEIEQFLGSEEKCRECKDSLGFYWVEKHLDPQGETISPGDVIGITYQGAFLNGRVVDNSPGEFTYTYGTPDQVLKGLNYVISRLKTGSDSKIILPSHLAFGEQGSSNGSIPPFTPMLYSISISQKK